MGTHTHVDISTQTYTNKYVYYAHMIEHTINKIKTNNKGR